MNESTTKAPKELGELIGTYDTPYALNNGCLSIERITKSGIYYTRLCNFAPKIVSEVTVDDGAELTRKYLIGGKDDSGRELPLVEVAATELEKMEWMLNHWDASLDLDVVPQVQRHVRRAIKSTAIYATKKSVFAHTGWKKIDGKYFFLLPGNEKYDVELKGSLQSYRAATTFKEEDLAYLSGFLYSDFIPHKVSYPCLSLVFLTPLNEFLRRVGHEPKFILLLLGRTGSMKSTVAALFLSFFGNFSNTDLPMSFRDTANSIIHSSFALKDVLTCIDDYHPTGRKESDAMKATMQALARGYGDKAARNRLTADIQLRETRPPQGNAIVTAEFAPDIGESGTARLFCVEMKPGEFDLPSLTMIQEQAHGGMLMRCMFAYTEWLRKVYLADSESEEKFLAALKVKYERYRADWRAKLREKEIKYHDRLPDTLACLEVGFCFLLSFLCQHGMLKADNAEDIENKLTDILLDLADKQSEAVEQDKPTHIFIRKFLAMVECGQGSLIPVEDCNIVLPSSCFGYEDEKYYYLFFEATHKAVKKFCEDQGEGFSISSKSLGKALADEGFINTDTGENTRSMRFGSKSKRVLLLYKESANKIMSV